MRYRRVRIMAPDEQVKVRAIDPLFCGALGMMRPRERPPRLRLTHAIYGQRVVRRGTAILIPLVAITDVFKGSAIDEHRAAFVGNVNTEGVSMTVATTTRTERASVDHDLTVRCIYDIQARIRK